jgi:hypothetical protein
MQEKLLGNYTIEEIIQAANLIPHLWVEQNKIVTESGQPIEFKNRRFLKAIYDDFSPKIAILKPPQIGATIMNCLKALYVAHELHKDIVYTLPTQSDVQDIVGGSFNRIIAQNKILQIWVHDHDTIEQKSVGESLIRFRGTFSPKQATMVPASLLIHDEVDSSDPEVLTLYQTRLEAQVGEENKWRWYFSHPSLAGHGVDVYWQKSDKKEWHITCPACRNEDHMRWPENVDMDREIYVCAKCKAELPTEARINGRWKNQDGVPWKGKVEGGYEFSGWHSSQLMLYNKSAKEIINAFRDPLKTKQYFYNYVLGLPFIGSDDRIEPSVVLRNCVDVTNGQEGINIIGADTGHGIHYVIMNAEGAFYYDHETTITATKTPYDVIRDHLLRFERSRAVFDQGGDLIGVRKLREEFPGRVFLCFYRRDRKTNDIITWGEKDKFGEVYVDRNEMMTLVVDQLRDTGRIRLNGTKDEWEDFAQMFDNIYREKVVVAETPGKDNPDLYGARYVWKRNGPDHYCHAFLYAIVGLSRFSKQMAKVVTNDDVWAGTPKERRLDYIARTSPEAPMDSTIGVMLTRDRVDL